MSGPDSHGSPAEHDFVAAVNRIRHSNPRVIVISGRGGSRNARTLLGYLLKRGWRPMQDAM
jgi:fructoselysine-6-P-deglycase FrlB-like protein